MGTLSIYVIPEQEIDPEAFRRTVKQVLLEMGVIEDENYSEPNWWLAGESSASIFENGGGEDVGFEYCIVYGSPHVEIIPQDPAELPSCPACGADVSEEFYDVINDIEERHEEEPGAKAEALEGATVSCPKCRAASRITNLKADVGILLSRTWINFEDAPGSLRDDWLSKFNEHTGWKNRCLEYWYT
jgi:hypothetical protein